MKKTLLILILISSQTILPMQPELLKSFKESVSQEIWLRIKPFYSIAMLPYNAFRTYQFLQNIDEQPRLKKKLISLHVAAQNGDCDAMEYALQQGANIHASDAAGHTALWHASMYAESKKRKKMCKLLLTKGSKAETASLERCVSDNDIKTTKLLVNSGISIKKSLLFTPDPQNIGVSYMLLYYGALLHTRDNISQDTPLTIAAKNNNQALCLMLVRHQLKKNQNRQDLKALLEQTNNEGKIAFEYCQLDCLNPDKIDEIDKNLEDNLARNDELLKLLLMQDSKLVFCPTPDCTFAFEPVKMTFKDRMCSIAGGGFNHIETATYSDNLRSFLSGENHCTCPGCGQSILEISDKAPQNLKPDYGKKSIVPKVDGDVLNITFAPILPGFYYMKSSTPYRGQAGSCGIHTLYNMAQLESKILGSDFSEDKFKSAQQKTIPDFSEGTYRDDRELLVKELIISPVICLRIDQDIDEKSFKNPLKKQLNIPIEKQFNQAVQAFKTSKGAYCVHFMCCVPGHVFLISVTRNAHDEQAIYLFDNLNENPHYQKYPEYISRYIKNIYSRFF